MLDHGFSASFQNATILCRYKTILKMHHLTSLNFSSFVRLRFHEAQLFAVLVLNLFSSSGHKQNLLTLILQIIANIFFKCFLNRRVAPSADVFNFIHVSMKFSSHVGLFRSGRYQQLSDSANDYSA